MFQQPNGAETYRQSNTPLFKDSYRSSSTLIPSIRSINSHARVRLWSPVSFASNTGGLLAGTVKKLRPEFEYGSFLEEENITVGFFRTRTMHPDTLNSRFLPKCPLMTKMRPAKHEPATQTGVEPIQLQFEGSSIRSRVVNIVPPAAAAADWGA